MQAKFINAAGFSIAYIEKNETAANVVFFIHGNSCSSQIWYKQFSSSIFDNFHLIAIDLPGHGYSSKSNNPKDDYSPLGTAAILVQILKAIVTSKPYILVGFSYGTNLIAEMLNYGINPKGIVFAGACVIGKGFGMEIFTAEKTIYFEETISREKAIAFLSSYLHDKDDASLYADAYLKTDILFRPSLMQNAAGGNVSDEISLLEKQDIPVLVVYGEDEKMVKVNYLKETGIKLWKNKVSLLKDAGHFVHTDQSEAFSQLLAEYTFEQL